MPAKEAFDDVRWLITVTVIFQLFLVWLVTFAAAWVFPQAWRFWGVVLGILWGGSSLAEPTWRTLIGQPGELLVVVAWFQGPLLLAAEGLELPTAGLLYTLFALALAILACLFFAWTGHQFRIIR